MRTWNWRDLGIGLAVGLAVGWMLAGFFGEWRPAGNDRIVNARTGALRVTTTGENLGDYLTRVKREREAEEQRMALERIERERREKALPPEKRNGGWGDDFLPPDLR